MRKKALVVFLLFVLCLPYFCFALVKPTEEFYVNDYANLLNIDVERYIIDKSFDLDNKTGVQIVVVTVPTLEGKDIESYATELFRDFGIGDKGENNGLLLLLALEERTVRVEAGYGLEGILPDAKTGRIQDEYMIPYFKEDNFVDGIKNGYNAFLKEVCDYYEVDCNAEVAVAKTDEMTTEGLIVMIVFILLFLVIIIHILRNVKKTGGFSTNRRTTYYVGRSHSSGSRSSNRIRSGSGGRSGGGGSTRKF